MTIKIWDFPHGARGETDKQGDDTFLAGPSLTLADIAISTSLVVATGALGKVLPASLVAYQERLQALPTYQRAKEKQQR